ncbi:hypothetical protein NKR23_g10055 [Pleurostoma richardsiae]|uniref:Uncharacterized protein n=1 Tax=Pleurostoma richardsiae TaxID=41990 RepID=A0AA38VC15_9PEZI|nr:hypothetical protein NKR23_g10055 [Pleurostoma richardsiae]
MAISDYAIGAIAFTQRQADRVVNPAARQQAWNNTRAFATERPLLFSFIASQLLLSFLPLLLFASFALSTVTFALATALLFSLFWIGVAAIVLIPALCVSFGAALLLWSWGAASFLVAQWCYYRVVPTGVKHAEGGDWGVSGNESGESALLKREDGGQGGLYGG